MYQTELEVLQSDNLFQWILSSNLSNHRLARNKIAPLHSKVLRYCQDRWSMFGYDSAFHSHHRPTSYYNTRVVEPSHFINDALSKYKLYFKTCNSATPFLRPSSILNFPVIFPLSLFLNRNP